MSRGLFDRFATVVSRGSGKTATFVVAVGLIVVWAISGPFFDFSETWQLVVNTATTIITFLMVFVLQHTQNRDGQALQAKLDDLIFAAKRADNRLIGAEQLSESELRELRAMMAKRVQRDKDALEEIDDTIEAVQGKPEPERA
jgi:low affinity Fe/Cu permease